MDTTRAQQQALDDELVAPADCLKIGKSNLRLSSTLKSKEPTLQVVLDSNSLHSTMHLRSLLMYLKYTCKSSGLLFALNSLVRNLKNLYLRRTFYLLSETLDILCLRRKIGLGMSSPVQKRIKSLAKGDKAAKKKKPTETSMDKGLTMLSDVALTEAEQLKLVIERSKTQTHSSHASGSGADEGTGDIPGVPDVPTYGSDDEQISWKSSEEDDEDEVNVSENDDDNDNNDDDDDVDNQDEENQDDDDDEQTDSDNDGDDFVHPKFSTHDDEARQDEVNEEDSFDPRVQTPSHIESTNDESNYKSDEDVQGTNTEEEKMIEEATHEEDEVNELYRDVNINLEGRDIVMTDAPLPNVQATQETEDTHVILTAPINPEGQRQSSSVSSGFVSNMLNPRPDTSIDSIFNTKETSLVDVPVITIAEPPLVFATTLPPPPTPLITHMFDHRLKTLEIDFSEFKQTNQFAEAVSSIHGIVDAYLANKMQKAVKTSIQL
ncbi:hypothetical protein Tco_0214117 [Tanacetum coccineum]